VMVPYAASLAPSYILYKNELETSGISELV
jgi:hypothetical protein